MGETDTLKKWINESNYIVFFGGAGVSTESGIPDFRSTDGLYHQEYDYPPETIISHSFYRRNPEEFYRFYKNKMLFPEAKPNAAHLALAKLEQQGKVRAVITQNIDGLHQAAGSREVLELLQQEAEEEYSAANGVLIAETEHLAEVEQLSLANLL